MDFFQKPKILTIVIIGLLVINLGTLGFLWFHKAPIFHHEFPPFGEMRGPGEMKGFLEDQLNLNDKQREEFNSLREEHHKEIMVIQDSIRTLKDRMFEQLSANPPDSLKTNSIAGAIGENQKRIELLAFGHFQKVRSICDDNQKQKFDKITKDIVRNLEMMPMMQHMEMRHGLPAPMK